MSQFEKLDKVLRGLYAMSKDTRYDAATRRQLAYYHYLLQQGLIDVEDTIQELENFVTRNPEFDGDWVGRPTDDFED